MEGIIQAQEPKTTSHAWRPPSGYVITDRSPAVVRVAKYTAVSMRLSTNRRWIKTWGNTTGLMHNRGEVDAPAVIFISKCGNQQLASLQSTKEKRNIWARPEESQTEDPKIWETGIRGTFID